MKSKKSKETLLKEIFKAAKALGWEIAIPDSDDDEIPGLIMGEVEWLEPYCEMETEQ